MSGSFCFAERRKMKKIRSSKRGLTFSIPSLKIGAHYRYVIDKWKKEVSIIPDENGNMTVSRKKSSRGIKPLVDIRSTEVRKLVSEADYIELETLKDGSVLVRTKKKTQANSAGVVSIQEILQSKTSEFIIPTKMLAVSGGYPTTLFGRPTLAEDSYFEYLSKSAFDGYVKRQQKKEIKKVYDVISLFSGAGMLDKAFMDGRFRFVYGVDFEPAAVETYRRNIGDHIECKDIRKVDADMVPNADVVIGGPCCQAYSNANRTNADSKEAEEKRLLFEDYARIVKAKKVKVWVVENVPELLTKNDAFYFNRLCDMLSDYEITATVVTDNEVGGYSTRKRAIVIGSKIGKIELPQLKKVTSKTVRDALSKVDSTWLNFNDVTKPGAETVLKMSYVPEGGNWKDIPESIHKFGPSTQSNTYRRLEWDNPSITLTNFRKANILHPTKNRTLSVAEASSIMGLEKDFTFFGNLSEMQQMCANGVTQAIGKFVKNAVLKKLDVATNVVCI